MKILNAALLLVFTLWLGMGTARADSIELQPVADTGLLESYPTNNLGSVPAIVAGKTPKGRARGLFRFDLTQLPPGITVTSVTFTIQVVVRHSAPAPGSNFTLHRLLKDWGEGNGQANIGDLGATGESTWQYRFVADAPWTPMGGGADVDYVSAGSSTQFIDDLGSYTFPSTARLVADVQAWLTNPGANFGWMLITESEDIDFTARRITTREDPSTPPKLTVLYTTGGQPPPPATPTISKAALVGNQIRFSFAAESNRTYAVEFRSTIDSGAWGTLTNIPVQPAATIIDVTDAASGGSRFYRIRTP